MDKKTFLAELKDTLNRETDLDENMELSALPEWDSLGIMSVITLFDVHFSINLDFSEMENMKTVRDLLIKAGIE